LTVVWNWGGAKPGGTVEEVKEQGEIAITSNRGNVIKKNASPDNPGVHVARSGNDVVKRASELQKTGGSSAKKDETKKNEEKDHKPANGDSEKKTAEKEEEGEGNQNDKTKQSKNVRTNGTKHGTDDKVDSPAKKQKTDSHVEKKSSEKESKSNGSSGQKKGPAKREKKVPSTPAAEGSISRRTRSKA
jgi:hypothetical protein